MKSETAHLNQLAVNLRTLIKKSGWSIVEVSKRAQVKSYFIYDVIAGKNSNPSFAKLARIADVLGVSLIRLMKAPKSETAAARHGKKSGVETSVFVPSDQFIKLNEADRLRPFDDVMQDVLLHAVKFCNGNKTEAADGLKMSRSRFYRKLGAQHELLSQMDKQ